MPGSGSPYPSSNKEEQLLFLLVSQLASAQFDLANGPMTQRLWDEVAALELDPERVTALLYGGQDPHDREALRQLDSAWCSRPEPTRRGWFRRLRSGGGRRSVPPAALRAHPSAR
ncbi:MAG: hypothetical protein VKK62_08945 [Synechococcaceae cyanobacterium]|nr:hypothetical protein [Synechococcaceae cyanobacterium]